MQVEHQKVIEHKLKRYDIQNNTKQIIMEGQGDMAQQYIRNELYVVYHIKNKINNYSRISQQ